jgi:hypothetical protein
VVDDDPSPPTITSISTTPAVIYDNMSSFEVDVGATSPRGIADIGIIYNGQPYGIDYGTATRDGDSFAFTLPSPVVPGTYPFEMYAIDNDTDWGPVYDWESLFNSLSDFNPSSTDQGVCIEGGSFSIVDDDSTPPTINGVSYNATFSDKVVTFPVYVNCSDVKGIGSVAVQYSTFDGWGNPVTDTYTGTYVGGDTTPWWTPRWEWGTKLAEPLPSPMVRLTPFVI